MATGVAEREKGETNPPHTLRCCPTSQPGCQGPQGTSWAPPSSTLALMRLSPRGDHQANASHSGSSLVVLWVRDPALSLQFLLWHRFDPCAHAEGMADQIK